LRDFLLFQLRPANCIAALDAAMADLVLRLQPQQLEEVRALMQSNSDIVTAELARRASRNEELSGPVY
jgi:hypothetical protein